MPTYAEAYGKVDQALKLITEAHDMLEEIKAPKVEIRSLEAIQGMLVLFEEGGLWQ